jgi:SAM-dependent methyltransferase
MIKRIKNKILLKIVKLLLNADNFIYSRLSKYAVMMGKGIHPKHRLMKYHDFFMDNINPGDTVLDVGCGNGSVAFDMAKKVKNVVGIDIDDNNIRVAKKNFLLDNVDYICGDILNWDSRQKFDVILLSNVLEHIEKRVELLKKVKNLGDKLLIRVPMIDRSWVVLYKREMGIDYRLDKTHYIEYTFDDFQNEIDSAGLEIKSYSVQFGEIWAVVRNKV